MDFPAFLSPTLGAPSNARIVSGGRSTAAVERRPRRSLTVYCSAAEGDSEKAEEKGDAGNMKPMNFGSTVSKVIDFSFRRVWIVLLTQGIGDLYYESLKNFILGVMAAYKRGYAIAVLQMELSMNTLELSGDEKLDQALQLKDGEKRTRMIWIEIVYLTLMKIGFPTESKTRIQEPKDSLLPALKVLVEQVCDAHSRGFTFDAMKMEMSMNRKPEEPELSADAASIRSQWMRIAYITNEIVAPKHKIQPDTKEE